MMADKENEIATISDEEKIMSEVVDFQDLGLEFNDKGNVKSVFQNYVRIIESDPYIKGKISWNGLDGRIMMTGFFWELEEHPLRDVDILKLRKFIADRYGISKRTEIEEAVSCVAFDHIRHPVLEELDSLPQWDGQSRLRKLLPRYLGAEESDYTEAVTKLLFYGAIQRIRSPGIKFDTCIVLADTKQGTGKSSLCRMMALKDEWFCDSLGDLSDNKKAFETLRGHWIIELGEMIATRRTKDVEAIKAYLSRTADDYRQPYGVHSERYLRQCVFIGTTNKPSFLPDDKTGNRRFIPVLCDGDQAELHPLDDIKETREYIRQCYAEALVTGEAEGWPLILDKRFLDQVTALQAQSAPDDPRVGMIQEWLDTHTEVNEVCSRMLWDEIFDDERQPSPSDIQKIGEIMSTQIDGWIRRDIKHKYRIGKYGPQRTWIRIPSIHKDDFLPATESPFDGIEL